MNDYALFTLRDIAGLLRLPESTVRYYRDVFQDHIPTVGEGRRRRYPRDALETFKLIAARYREGRAREEIAAELTGETVATVALQAPPAGDGMPALVASILDGERERRDALWQIAREIVRIGEAVDRQQVVIEQMLDRLARLADGALPADEGAGAAVPSGAWEGRLPDAAAVTRELERVREELERERTTVDRLRAAKLELERQAVAAFEELEDRRGPRRRWSLLGRLLARYGA